MNLFEKRDLMAQLRGELPERDHINPNQMALLCDKLTGPAVLTYTIKLVVSV